MGRAPVSPAVRHRALASPMRARLLEVLRAAPDGADVTELAGALQLHANTVRAHLAKLEEAALVVSETEPPTGRGRPRLRYRAIADEPSDDDGYRFLSGVLAAALADDGSAPLAEEAGRRWGRYLVERPAPGERLDEEARVARLTAVFDELGFDPVLRGREVDLHRCPFRDVATAHPEVVCGVHLGIMRGALEELGADADAAALTPFVTPVRCVARLPDPAG